MAYSELIELMAVRFAFFYFTFNLIFLRGVEIEMATHLLHVRLVARPYLSSVSKIISLVAQIIFKREISVVCNCSSVGNPCCIMELCLSALFTIKNDNLLVRVELLSS